MEVGMATRRNPKVVGGVHFVWVQKYRWSKLHEHWLSISHPSTVRVFEPRKEHGHKPKYWTVVLYKAGKKFPIKDDLRDYVENYHGTKKSTWKKAAKLAKRKLDL
jgi:hypothetical protein